VLSYPLVETIHKDSICYVTEAPAAVVPAVAEEARKVAEKAIACLDGAGIFGWEAAAAGLCMYSVCSLNSTALCMLPACRWKHACLLCLPAPLSGDASGAAATEMCSHTCDGHLP
jgi:hypothetical protein